MPWWIGYAQVEADAWFLVRWPDGTYELHRVAAASAHPPVAARTVAASPSLGDGGTVYLGGFDANKAPAHNTAWIAAGRLNAMLNEAHWSIDHGNTSRDGAAFCPAAYRRATLDSCLKSIHTC